MGMYFNARMVHELLLRSLIHEDDSFYNCTRRLSPTTRVLTCMSTDIKKKITPQDLKYILSNTFLEQCRPKTLKSLVKGKRKVENENLRLMVWEGKEDSEDESPVQTCDPACDPACDRACGGHYVTHEPKLDSKMKTKLPLKYYSEDLKPEMPLKYCSEDLKSELPAKFYSEDLKPELPAKFYSEDLKPELPAKFYSEDLKPELPAKFYSEDLKTELPLTLYSKDLKVELPPKFYSEVLKPELIPPLDSEDLKAEWPPTLDSEYLKVKFPPPLGFEDPKVESELNLKCDSQFKPQSVPKLDPHLEDEDDPMQVLHWNPNLKYSSNSNMDTATEPCASAPIKIQRGSDPALKLEQSQMKKDIKRDFKAEPSGSKSSKKTKEVAFQIPKERKTGQNSEPIKTHLERSKSKTALPNSKPSGLRRSKTKIDIKTESSFETFSSGSSTTKVHPKTNPSSKTSFFGLSQSSLSTELTTFSSQEELMQYVLEVSDMYTRYQRQQNRDFCPENDPKMEWLLLLKRVLSSDYIINKTSESKEQIKLGFQRFYQSFKQTFLGTKVEDKPNEPTPSTVDPNFYGAMIFGPSCDEMAIYCIDRVLVAVNMLLNRDPKTFQTILTSGMQTEPLISSESDPPSMEHVYDFKVEMPSSDTSSEEKRRPSTSDRKRKVTVQINSSSSDSKTKK
ncbi:hypothetical protein KR026_009486 [Drosophila bipectinata]|nr:hypothetical protein KR026_009486 [Drosophila bipectinata]